MAAQWLSAREAAAGPLHRGMLLALVLASSKIVPPLSLPFADRSANTYQRATGRGLVFVHPLDPERSKKGTI